MTSSSVPPTAALSASGGRAPVWKMLAPFAVGLLLLACPVPAGLPTYAWRYFSLFVAVVVGIVLEPLPGAAIGLMGVTLATALAPWLLFSPAQLADPKFNPVSAATAWALSGFSDGSVWLVFGAYMFALGYEKSGLGRRIALRLIERLGGRSLSLGYGIMLADLLLAPFTPSNTARSAGTIYPVIRNLPLLYDSLPFHASSRRIGSYLMWVALAADCVTSSLFLTAMAPNLLGVQLARKIAGVDITWAMWLMVAVPFAGLLLTLVPLLTYWIYPPTMKRSPEVPAWASGELERMGPLSRAEITLACVVMLALALWILAGAYLSAAAVALVGISLLLATRVFTWNDVASNAQAWTTLSWFATMMALADGLNRVGFIAWVARAIGAHLAGVSPLLAMTVLLAVFFFAHYLFASVTAHATALLPVMLAAGLAIPGVAPVQFALLLCLQFGIMGVVTPYATGPSPVYQGSGYLPAGAYWRLGTIFGLVYVAVYLVVTIPWSGWVLGR